MALTGELTDLSLAELIEFFCNQRKTGRLTVSYPHAPAYFYLQSGTVVHASIGVLRGIEAVYYALTQSNASFNFSTAYEAPDHTINQPWTSVVLEGLRRMDEGIHPRNPFPDKVEFAAQTSAEKPITPPTVEAHPSIAPALVSPPSASAQLAVSAAPVADNANEHSFISESQIPEPAPKPAAKKESGPSDKRPVSIISDSFLSSAQSVSKSSAGPWKVAAVFAALILIVAGVAVPWYARGRAARAVQSQPIVTTDTANPTATQASENADNAGAAAAATDPPEETTATTDAAEKNRREREARAREEARLRAKTAETTNATSSSQPPSAAAAPATANNGSKKVVVQVTYDENGRVTQATGNDPTALRIARQKRFPAGKAGSATITIPIN